MSADAITRIERLRGHKLSDEEAARLREISGSLNLRDDDAVWNILAALEYQRVFYETLPEKIAETSTEVLRGFSIAADKETAAAQARLAESVAELAQKLAIRINMATLLPMGLAALVSLPAYGSLILWAGICIGSGQTHDPAWILKMPSGILMGGLILGGGLPPGFHAAREFADGGGEWKKRLIFSRVMPAPGSVLVSLAL